MTERIISADSHVKVEHDQIKANLATRYHESYDEAVTAFQERMSRGAAKANQAGAVMKAAEGNAAFLQPAYWDPIERLKAMAQERNASVASV